MKYVIFLCDGMADNAVEELGNKTPMEAADKPYMDSYSKKSVLGLCKTVPDNLKPGSDVANMSVMGYNPDLYYTGRSPLEAASIGVDLKDNETSCRANLVTLSGEGDFEDLYMEDYSAGEIKTQDAKEIIEALQPVINDDLTAIYSGVSYRHLLVLKDKASCGTLTPPHDISKKPIKEYLPTDEKIRALMKKSYEFLKNHPINERRIKEGKKPVSCIWVWGEGKRPRMKSFKELFNKDGAVISAVDLIKGIGILTGMESIDVPNVTGNIDTNFEGKAQAAIDALKNGKDFVYIHMEAPDECGHRFEAENKKLSIEYIDKRVFKPVTEYLESTGEDFAVMAIPDHYTPVAIGTHARGNVPFFAYLKSCEKDGDVYTEKTAAQSGLLIEKGHELIEKFFSLDLWK